MKENENLEYQGFRILSDEIGANEPKYTATCSGSRSDCCTRVCSTSGNFVETAEQWEEYLAFKAGEVQY